MSVTCDQKQHLSASIIQGLWSCLWVSKQCKTPASCCRELRGAAEIRKREYEIPHSYRRCRASSTPPVEVSGFGLKDASRQRHRNCISFRRLTESGSRSRSIPPILVMIPRRKPNTCEMRFAQISAHPPPPIHHGAFLARVSHPYFAPENPLSKSACWTNIHPLV